MPDHLDVEPVLLESEKDLRNYFSEHAKPECMHRLGIEAEFLAVNSRTGAALPYSGKNGVGAMLQALACSHYYHPVKQHGSIIALNRKDLSVSLEPGAQVELSAPPVANVFQVEEQVLRFTSQLKDIEKKFPGSSFLSTGIQPFSRLEDIEWTPKDRYKIMRRRLPHHGPLSQWMMKMTATNQVNFDYSSEADAHEKMKVALLATPAAAALFANSCVSEGRLNGYQTFRMQIWRQTDQTRSGYLTRFLKSRSFFKDYLEYILDVPLLFVIRGKKYVEMKNRTFREFIRKGYKGYKATLADFELHLTVVFPDVRLKQYLEIRCVDAQSTDRISAVAAFWKGLIYSHSARSKVLKLFKNVPEEALQQAYADMPKSGLKAELAGHSLLYWAKQLTEISRAGLAGQKTTYENRDEAVFLAPIERDLKKGLAPADYLRQGFALHSVQNRFWTLNRVRI